MDAERVLATLGDFKAATGVKMYASMIVGLPGDSLDDAYNWFERFKSEKLFSEWGFQALGMTFDEFGQGDSIFSKNPEKFGYTIEGALPIVPGQTARPRSYNWTSNMGFTNNDAAKVANDINSQSREIAMAGGFGVAEYWFHGGTDDDIENTRRKEFSVGHRGSENGRKRALVQVNEARKVLGNQLRKW
jgi:hypothetical protein